MKDLLPLTGVIAIGLLLCGVSVALGDRQTLVSPPDAVAEGFARAVAERRYDVAPRYLSDELARTVTGHALRERFEPIRRQIGDENSIESETVSMQLDVAAARATVDAEFGTMVLELPLVREHGVWKIGRLPEEVAVALKSTAR